MEETDLDKYPDRVAEIFKDKTIFITGGTGFMGKVLIEKLLRSCGGLKKIIMLIRSKKGKRPQERIKDIMNNPLFDKVKKERGTEVVQKLEAIDGDVMLPELGISKEDRQKIAKEAEIIFHCAATIRFDEPLKKAVLLNVRGTKYMLDLAKECKKLLIFVHLSTAYCHLNEKVLRRRIYNLTSSSLYKISWSDIIEIGRKVIETRMPLNNVAWYPGGSMKKSRIVHNICFYLFHMLPAILVDTLLYVLGFKPILMRVQQRISKGFEVFEYYANNQWEFNNEEALKARDILNPRERQTYKVDGDGIDYVDYFTDCVHCTRLYILNEPDDTIPAAKRHMKIMYVVDVVVKALFCLGMLYLLYTKLVKPYFGWD
nr:unnamed protein product [Callosobruchus analis]